ncbi:Phosphopantetheine adenylyltransferase [Labeo rohita]|uniref:Phosphopantetheine adenylyltransferase n=1 Tax=Labeo rohita TaxID=84645 RepID=A0ABQ8L1W9_LABRO|nr:Phosphopantetheine adenylyltransferase [Labeo rohita]
MPRQRFGPPTPPQMNPLGSNLHPSPQPRTAARNQLSDAACARGQLSDSARGLQKGGKDKASSSYCCNYGVKSSCSCVYGGGAIKSAVHIYTYNNTTDLQEYAETVTAYINKCTEDVTVTKTITVHTNQKPWMTGEVYRLLKARNVAFRAGDEASLKTARANLSRGIREAKRQYSRGISHRFSDSRDTPSLWRGIQTITDYEPPPQTCDSTISLLNELNTFFPHFEVQNSTTAQKTPPPPGDQVMTLSPDSVRRSLSRINARKALGPDNIPGRVLRDCAVELTGVFTDIFNISLNQAVVPACFKATTIIPVPKNKSSPYCFNDYRPVALTPILILSFTHQAVRKLNSLTAPPPLPSSAPQTSRTGLRVTKYQFSVCPVHMADLTMKLTSTLTLTSLQVWAEFGGCSLKAL